MEEQQPTQKSEGEQSLSSEGWETEESDFECGTDVEVEPEDNFYQSSEDFWERDDEVIISGTEPETDDEEAYSDEEVEIDSRDSGFVEKLKLLAFKVTTGGKNTLLHRIVLENSHPNVAMNETYLNGVLRSITDDIPVNCLNEDGYTPLHLAVMRRSNQMVEKMLSCIQHLSVNAKTSEGETSLTLAVSLGDCDIITTLLHHDADINMGGYKDNKPLHYAVEENNLKIAQLLIDNGSDVSLGNYWGKPPLLLCKSLDMGKLLISCGADINSKSFFDRTPLHSAVLLESSEFSEYLLEHGAEVDARDINNWTALHKAAYGENDKSVKLLIEKGSNVNAATKWRKTSLHFACHKGCRDIVEMLITNGANIDALDIINETLLHFAVEAAIQNTYNIFAFGLYNRYLEIIKFLLLKGANIHKRNKFYRTPLDLAKNARDDGDDDVFKILISKKRRKH